MVPHRILADILWKICRAFGGFTVGRLLRYGGYTADDGAMMCDATIKVEIDVSPERVQEVRGLAAHIARVLEQKTLYFKVTAAQVEFVKPAVADRAQTRATAASRPPALQPN